MTTPLARASSLVSPFVRRSTSTRSFASVRGAEVSSVYGKREHGYDAPPSPSDISTASTLLEDMPEHGTAREDGLPPFVVSRDRGFLPRKDPLVDLPEPFGGLESLLRRMTIHQPVDAKGDRAQGLLAKGDFGQAVLDELSETGPEACAVRTAVHDARNGANNVQLLAALFRDYCFMTSAYLLEPVDAAYRRTGFYARGRSTLPAQLAVPLKQLADALGHFPYMEYASSYALTNYQVKDPAHQGNAGPYSFNNMELVRAFEDASGSERGFILVHVEMVSFSGKLVAAAEDALAAAQDQDLPAFESALQGMLTSYRRINSSMETMWARSLPEDYLKYRSFIFGTGPAKMNAMFPEGVVYEGVSEEPMCFRGESGANDSLVPLGDNVLELTAHMPDNELTKTLRDFRSYRPQSQRHYIAGLEFRASQAGVRRFALEGGSAKAKALYVLLVDQIREFRSRHWRFTQEYIIKRTNYDIATGGSPILQYLPHNLRVVLQVLTESYGTLTAADDANLGATEKDASLRETVHLVGERAKAQLATLRHEVDALIASKAAEAKRAGNEHHARGMLETDEDQDRAMKRGMVGCDGVG